MALYRMLSVLALALVVAAAQPVTHSERVSAFQSCLSDADESIMDCLVSEVTFAPVQVTVAGQKRLYDAGVLFTHFETRGDTDPFTRTPITSDMIKFDSETQFSAIGYVMECDPPHNQELMEPELARKFPFYTCPITGEFIRPTELITPFGSSPTMYPLFSKAGILGVSPTIHPEAYRVVSWIKKDIQLALSNTPSAIPDELLCPLTQTLLLDPVATSLGKIFNYPSIMNWITVYGIHPPARNVNRKKLHMTKEGLLPAPKTLRSRVIKYMQFNAKGLDIPNPYPMLDESSYVFICPISGKPIQVLTMLKLYKDHSKSNSKSREMVDFLSFVGLPMPQPSLLRPPHVEIAELFDRSLVNEKYWSQHPVFGTRLHPLLRCPITRDLVLHPVDVGHRDLLTGITVRYNLPSVEVYSKHLQIPKATVSRDELSSLTVDISRRNYNAQVVANLMREHWNPVLREYSRKLDPAFLCPITGVAMHVPVTLINQETNSRITVDEESLVPFHLGDETYVIASEVYAMHSVDTALQKRILEGLLALFRKSYRPGPILPMEEGRVVREHQLGTTMISSVCRLSGKVIRDPVAVTVYSGALGGSIILDRRSVELFCGYSSCYIPALGRVHQTSLPMENSQSQLVKERIRELARRFSRPSITHKLKSLTR